MTFPITCNVTHLNHKGGTKSYEVLELRDTTGRTLIVNRWGKTGRLNQHKIEFHAYEKSGQDAFNRKLSEKNSGGYNQDYSLARKEVFDDSVRLVQYLSSKGVNTHPSPFYEAGFGAWISDAEDPEQDTNFVVALSKEDVEGETMRALPEFGRF